MNTDLQCFPCFLRQALRVTHLIGSSSEVQLAAIRGVAACLSHLDIRLSPPANAEEVYAIIAAATGCDDPYRALKQASNAQALQSLPELQQELDLAADPLELAVRLAIAGNIIDYGAYATFDLAGTLARCRSEVLAVNHLDVLRRRLAGLPPGGTVLYLTDNCGEIVYDSLLLRVLHRQGLLVTVAVKDGPIINDALREDAESARLDQFCRIISNGSRCPGTVLARCSAEFRDLFARAELVIAKGQGNFESLSAERREIFFLFTLKCPVAATHLAELVAPGKVLYSGLGEMVVYSSAEKQQKGA